MSALIDTLRTTDATTVDLVLAAQAGDRDAYGELVQRFYGTVRRVVLMRVRNDDEADEITQDVFMQAMRKLHQLREPLAFGGWLRSTAVRMAINRITRRGPEFATEPETIEATCRDGDDPYANALAAERSSDLHDGLARLREMDREALTAFYLHGQSLAEISEDFGAPVGTIKRRLHTARKRLAVELENLAPA